MQNTIEVKLSASRSISFTAHHGHVQVIAEGGFIHPAELAEAKKAALQKLADATGTAYEYYEPRRDPANPGRNYQTRLIRRPDEGRCPLDELTDER